MTKQQQVDLLEQLHEKYMHQFTVEKRYDLVTLVHLGRLAELMIGEVVPPLVEAK